MPVIKAKICRNGNSAVITIPAEWRKRANVSIGDSVDLRFEGGGALIIEPPNRGAAERKAAYDELMGIIEQAPRIPWEDDSPEADRDLLESRYA